MHHWCRWHRWQITGGINDTGGKFCRQFPLCCWHRWQFCNRCQRYRRLICRRCQRRRWQLATGINDTGGCHWHRWQIMGTLSLCRQLKVNLKAKIYIYVSSTTQRWPNKIIKIFLIEDFFHLPPVSLTPVANLELRISPEFSEKFETVLMEYSGAGGKLIHEKNQKQKISWHSPSIESLNIVNF